MKVAFFLSLLEGRAMGRVAEGESKSTGSIDRSGQARGCGEAAAARPHEIERRASGDVCGRGSRSHFIIPEATCYPNPAGSPPSHAVLQEVANLLGLMWRLVGSVVL